MKKEIQFPVKVILSLLFISAVNAQTYDTRIQSSPHLFTWDDAYPRVEAYGDHTLTFDGCNIEYLSTSQTSSALINQGIIDTISARDFSRIQINNLRSNYIAARDHSVINLMHTIQEGSGQVQASEQGLLRIHGGTYGRAYTWVKDGRIEVVGQANIQRVTANTGGIVHLRAGKIIEASVSSTGVTIYDQGEISSYISANQQGLFILAGGSPPEDIRLFDQANLLVFQSQSSALSRNKPTWTLADLSQPGQNTNFNSQPIIISTDSGYKTLQLAAWNHGESQWAGECRLINLTNSLTLVTSPKNGISIIAFQAHPTQIVQLESSPDLKNWTSLGPPIVQSSEIHTEVIRSASTRYFRKKTWLLSE